MAQDLSIEDPIAVFFITIKTIASRLWFVNNRKLEEKILAYLAKYQAKYEIQLYAFVLMGNHYHLIARFPKGNKAAFLRSFNSIVARLTGELAQGPEKGKVWGRRARCQILPRPDDVRHWMLYAALNPVSSGLVAKLSEYPCYNSFRDAIVGRVRKFQLINWEKYNSRKRFNPKLSPSDFSTTYTLSYEKLPGTEQLTSREYQKRLLDDAENRRVKIIEERAKTGANFSSQKNLLRCKPGTQPKTSKSSQRYTKRPLILTLCAETKTACIEKYFNILSAFKRASLKFRTGLLSTTFPAGTYRPVLAVGATG